MFNLEKIKELIRGTNPLLSIVICTYNRHKYLRSSIEAFSETTQNCNRFEIIVVDNSDEEIDREENANLTKGVKGIRLIKSEPGNLSLARNTALRLSKSEFIAFIDDDAIPSVGWAENIIKTFQDLNEKVVAVGGPIYPIWKSPRPEWVSDSLLPPLTILDLGPSPRMLNPSEYIFGTNMAYRTKTLRQHGGFNQGLGRFGSKVLLSNEDTEIQKRLRTAGYDVFYNPEVSVYHTVHPERLKQEWFIRRMIWQAISDSFDTDSKESLMTDDLLSSCRKLGSENLIELLVSETESAKLFEARLEFVYFFIKRAMLN